PFGPRPRRAGGALLARQEGGARRHVRARRTQRRRGRHRHRPPTATRRDGGRAMNAASSPGPASGSAGTGSAPIVLLLHGPNLNRLGEGEHAVYGTATRAVHVAPARSAAERHGFQLEELQSNHEGELFEAIHAARKRVGAIVINPGAFTHYSWA